MFSCVSYYSIHITDILETIMYEYQNNRRLTQINHDNQFDLPGYMFMVKKEIINLREKKEFIFIINNL
jgi:hypothetical protein